jgi:hypothetical protein
MYDISKYYSIPFEILSNFTRNYIYIFSLFLFDLDYYIILLNIKEYQMKSEIMIQKIEMEKLTKAIFFVFICKKKKENEECKSIINGFELFMKDIIILT